MVLWSAWFAFVVVCLVAAAPAVLAEDDTEHLWQSNFSGKSIDCSVTNWMHTAKTSSTFCMTLQHVCCPTEFQNLTSGVTTKMLEIDMATPRSRANSPFSFESHYCFKFHRKGYDPIVCNFAGRPEHLPLSAGLDLHQKMGIMIVREPKSRLISAFLDGVHIENFPNRTDGHEMRKLFHEMDLNKSMNHNERLLLQAQQYADHYSQVGHQVKMLVNGLTLNLSVKNETVMHALVDRAVARMREFYFVGIFEQYSRSLRLFHELANKGTFLLRLHITSCVATTTTRKHFSQRQFSNITGTKPTDVELFPRRSTSADDKAFLMEHLRFEDPYDTQLYAAAQRIFQEEVDFVKKWKNVSV